MAYSHGHITATDMLDLLEIDQLAEMTAFSLYLQSLYRPVLGTDDRYPIDTAIEAMANWRLDRLLEIEEPRKARRRVDWAREGF